MGPPTQQQNPQSVAVADGEPTLWMEKGGNSSGLRLVFHVSLPCVSPGGRQWVRMRRTWESSNEGKGKLRFLLLIYIGLSYQGVSG